MNFNFGKEKEPIQELDPKTSRVVETILKKGVLSELDLIGSPENIQTIKDKINSISRLLIPGFSMDSVVIELKNQGVIKPIPPAPKPEKAPTEIIETKYIKLDGIKEIEPTEEEQKVIEANLLLKAIEDANIFKNEKELEDVWDQSLVLEKVRPEETFEHYNQFAETGLLAGGTEELAKDLFELNKIKKNIKNSEPQNPSERNKLEKVKKIATITEHGLAYMVSDLKMFGNNLIVDSAGEFNDIKHGIDDVMQIKNAGSTTKFLGLGIDVTFRGLHSEQFENKFFKLLDAVKMGYQPTVKYFKNHEGELMPEFVVPKMILCFDANDIKEIVYFIKNKNNPSIKEEIKKSPLKLAIMSQVVNFCKIMTEFSQEYGNDISQKYVEIIDTLEELGTKNSDIKSLLDTRDDEISKHLKMLVKKFKDIHKNEKPRLAK